MGLLTDHCTFSIFGKDQSEKGSFHCGDEDLDSFFLSDAFMQSDALLCKNYCFVLDENPQNVICAFTLSNDSIKKIPGSRKKRVEKNIPREKRYSSYPAVMIGRLGVSLSMQDKHLGSEVLDFIKAWFLDPLNKTGCRFILVDSYNQPRNVAFYQKNNFQFLFGSEEQEKEFRGIDSAKLLQTRLMYFDLVELI